MTLQFGVLGPLAVWSDGESVEVEGAKRRGLLAYLLTHMSDPQPLDRIVDALWAGSPSRGSDATVQTYVSQLRKLLALDRENARLLHQGGGYTLEIGADSLDAPRFEVAVSAASGVQEHHRRLSVLDDALVAWRGAPLDEFAGQGWADEYAGRWTRMYILAHELRARSLLEIGRHRDALPALEQLVATHPLHEPFWTQLVVARYRCGLQADALAAAREARQVLARELGIDPGPELLAVEHKVLAQDRPLDAPSIQRPSDAPSTIASVVAQLPNGVLTFMLTDIEASTELWDRRPHDMAKALVQHENVIEQAVRTNDGHLLKSRGEGDATLSVFARATDALDAAVALQRRLVNEVWPGDLELRTRIALHTGEAQLRNGDYYGGTLNRAVRIRGLASGGEILVSRATRDLVVDVLSEAVELIEAGEHSMKGLRRQETVFTVRTAGVDVLTSNSNVPRPPTESAPSRSVGIDLPVALDRHLSRPVGEPAARRAMQFRILGLLEVIGPEGPVYITGSRRRALLIRLLMAPGTPVPSARLIDDLWNGDPPDGAASTLQSHVSLLRRTLGTDRLLFRDGAYVLAIAPEQLDATHFEDEVSAARRSLAEGDAAAADSLLEAALARWRGNALGDVADTAWGRNEAARLEESRIGAIELRFDAQLALGRHREVVGPAEAALAEHPLRERIWAQMMLALYRSGRQSDALRTYQRLRHLLGEELGIAPSADLVALEDAILLQKPELNLDFRDARTPPASTTAASSADDATRAPASLPPGREIELARIHSICTEVLPDRGGRVVLIEGEPGVGVTTVLRAVEASQREGPTGPVVVTLSATGATPYTLRKWLGDAGEPGALSEVAEHDRASSAIGERAAPNGLVLIIDDAVELDQWSLGLIVGMARRPPPGTVVIVGAPTLTQVADEVGVRLAEVVGAPYGIELHLGRLDEPALRELVGRRWPDADPSVISRWAAHLKSWCDGHPLLVKHALSSANPLDEPTSLTVPASVEVLARRQLNELPNECRAYLAIAAELGSTIDLALVAAVAGVEPDVVAAALGPAITAGVVRRVRGPGAWEFDHGLLRDVVRRRVEPSDALRWHLSAGKLLRERGGRQAEVGRHLAAAVPLVDPDEARAAAMDAGELLLGAGSYREAADRFREAATLGTDVVERARALIGLGRALELAGERLTADAAYDEAARLAITAGSSDLLARAAVGGSAHSSAVRGRSGRRWRLQQARSRLPPDVAYRSEVVAELALELLNSGQPWPAPLDTEVRSIAQTEGSPTRVLAARVVVAEDEAVRGATAAAASELVELALVGDAPEHWASAALAVGIGVTLATGDWDAAARWIDELAGFGARTGEPRARWQSLVFRAVLAEGRGDSRTADAAATEALTVGERLEMVDAPATFALHHLGRAYREGSLAHLVQSLVNVDARYRVPVWDAIRAAASFDAGDRAAAAAHLDNAVDQLAVEDGRIDHFRSAALAIACRTAQRLGQTGVALDLAKQLDGRRGRFVVLGYGGPCLGPVDWHLVEVMAMSGREDVATALLADARTLCRRASASAWLTALDSSSLGVT